MKFALRKKIFAMKKSYFQSIINLHALKLTLNRSMCASEDEQGINKLWPERTSKPNLFEKKNSEIQLLLSHLPCTAILLVARMLLRIRRNCFTSFPDRYPFVTEKANSESIYNILKTLIWGSYCGKF